MRGTAQSLPDFCQPMLVFSAMIVSQLAVLVALLVPGRSLAALWEVIGLATLYTQWLVLVTMALLCLGRRWLETLPGWSAWLVAWAVSVCSTLLLADLALRVDRWLSMGWLPEGLAPDAFRLQTALVAALVAAALLRYLRVQARWQAGERVRAQARVQALQARIRPHFLFNTLNSIAALVAEQPRAAERAIEDLADVFRGSLREAEQPVPLEQELDLVRKYLAIEALRLGDRLTVEWQLDDFPPQATVLPFSLQLLVENAVRHGIQPSSAGGRIAIAGTMHGRRLCFELRNPLSAQTAASSAGMALDNLRQRLALVYAGAAQLDVDRGERVFVARIAWPC